MKLAIAREGGSALTIKPYLVKFTLARRTATDNNTKSLKHPLNLPYILVEKNRKTKNATQKQQQNKWSIMERRVLWSPKARFPSELKQFQAYVEKRHALEHFLTYEEFWQWSVDNLDAFWKAVWDYCEVTHSASPSEVLQTGVMMDEIPEWFKGARLNYAQNMLKYRDNHIAVISTGEQLTPHSLTYAELYDQVEKVAKSLRKCGVKVGDRVAAFLPNTEYAIICMLAASAVGAVFSGASPDFGVQGTLDRLGQIEPKVLFCTDTVFEDGRHQSQIDKLEVIVQGLPSLEHVVFCPFDGVIPEESFKVPKSMSMDAFIQLSAEDSAPFYFEQLPFDHPLVIMFTSGSTGKPKCLVHRAGGLLLQHRKEHLIHTSMSRKDVFLYYTTTGWMMWNWQVSALAEGATLVVFSGKPFLPTPGVLFKVVEDHKVTKFGISAKYIQSIRDASLNPSALYDLSTLDTVYSTGSPLSPEGFEYIYASISSTVMVASITGGTDICSLFGAPNTDLPVICGQVQCRGLGMSVDVWDEEGNSVIDSPGELVCTRPMPCMPIGFLNDSDHSKYRAAYFYNSKFPHVWCHGDYVQLDSVYGGLVMLGRSDGTLNPKGIRFGSADLYRIVEDFPEVSDSLAVGYKSPKSEDEIVVLFLKMEAAFTFSPEFGNLIKLRIREQLSPAHVPAIVMPIDDIPYTLSGKKTEVVVKRLLAGVPPASASALRNPEAIKFFSDLQLDKVISSAPMVPADDEIAMEISKMASTVINQPNLVGGDFCFVDAGFDSLTILRVKMYLGERYRYLIDAHALLLPGTTPTSVAKDIREASTRKAVYGGGSSVFEGSDVTLTEAKGVPSPFSITGPIVPVVESSSYELSLSSRRMAGTWVSATFLHLPILPNILRWRVAHEYFVHYLETLPLARDGESVKQARLTMALTRLAELHPPLRTRLQHVGTNILSETIASLIMPIKTTAILNDPAASFTLVKVPEHQMYDWNALHRLVQPTLSKGRQMMVAVWSESCSFIILGMAHMAFDMETRAIYFNHLKRLYKDLDRKDVYPTRLMDWPFVLSAALTRFQPLPNDTPITRITSKVPILTTMDYFTINVKIPKGQLATEMMAASSVGILKLIQDSTTSKGEFSMGYLGVADVAKDGYSGNGTVETYSVLNLPKDINQQECLAVFKTRKTYVVLDHLKHIRRYAGMVFLNLRVRSTPEPEIQMRSLCTNKIWPNNGGSLWMHFDIWPDSDVVMISFWVSHNLKGGLHKTLGSRVQHFFHQWGMKSDMTVNGSLPVLG
ncbi:hypothetical protein SmJEL517_g01202 [Synchytrium microbalum]|uniref:Acetoacetate--CoA ligase n=1 Tax=Synchytrium microbalum TaxID=1806994 RepID=A0A507CFD7_9FUNG|nr:uncharacterized protein SmJEL517_g01202 [Synchytrium microbalum]TPX36706.1 hypothetical protein SmJEL517_g01202 [Synchytrium microbalum]